MARFPFLRLMMIFLLLVMGAADLAAQQDRTQLEAEKKRLEEEIEYSNQLLQQTQKSKEISTNEVTVIKSKINKRESLIRTIYDEIALLDRQIASMSDSIASLEQDLAELKEEYALMIYYAYKNSNLYDRLTFIFSADDLNQAYQRLKYFQYYNEYRQRQAELIQLKTVEMEQKTRLLAEKKAEKQSLAGVQEKEKQQLTKEKGEKDQTIQSLSKKEKELRKSIREKEEAARKLQKAIEDIIAEEIRLAAERARTPGAEATSGGVFPLSPEEMALSADFAGNKGRLPWPVAQGIISGQFGQQPHPVLSNVKIMNNGIDIMTSPGQEVKSVFQGVVTRVINVPNNNNVVIIRHGEFLTVYSNLDMVYVHKGDTVTTGQRIGMVFTSPDQARTELHFEVWQAKTLLNPEEWIISR